MFAVSANAKLVILIEYYRRNIAHCLHKSESKAFSVTDSLPTSADVKKT
jgi:hypothetical protein